MKNMTIIFRGSIVLGVFGLLLATTGCGESTSTSDKPSVVEPSPPASTSSTSEERTLRGTLVKIEGDRYIVKDREGADQVFQTTSDTLVDQGMAIGDQIIVKIGTEGNVIAIRKDR